MNLISNAMLAAIGWHEGQMRKYGEGPYITHPMRVAHRTYMLTSSMCNLEMLAAAWCHDVLEDTPCTEQLLNTLIFEKATQLVVELTNVSKKQLPDSNRAARHKMDNERLWKVSSEAQIIKCADILDNGISIQKNDPDFWKVWRREKLELVTGFPDGLPGKMECKQLLV